MSESKKLFKLVGNTSSQLSIFKLKKIQEIASNLYFIKYYLAIHESWQNPTSL